MFDKVRVLFKDQPDLLKDFSQFLPEAHVVAAHLQQEHTKQMSIQSTNGPETKHSAGPPPLKRAAPGQFVLLTSPDKLSNSGYSSALF